MKRQVKLIIIFAIISIMVYILIQKNIDGMTHLNDIKDFQLEDVYKIKFHSNKLPTTLETEDELILDRITDYLDQLIMKKSKIKEHQGEDIYFIWLYTDKKSVGLILSDPKLTIITDSYSRTFDIIDEEIDIDLLDSLYLLLKKNI